jgi:hypothetical protein
MILQPEREMSTQRVTAQCAACCWQQDQAGASSAGASCLVAVRCCCPHEAANRALEPQCCPGQRQVRCELAAGLCACWTSGPCPQPSNPDTPAFPPLFAAQQGVCARSAGRRTRNRVAPGRWAALSAGGLSDPPPLAAHYHSSSYPHLPWGWVAGSSNSCTLVSCSSKGNMFVLPGGHRPHVMVNIAAAGRTQSWKESLSLVSLCVLPADLRPTIEGSGHTLSRALQGCRWVWPRQVIGLMHAELGASKQNSLF